MINIKHYTFRDDIEYGNITYYYIANENWSTDDHICYNVKLEHAEYQNILIKQFNAFNMHGETFFKNKEDAINALVYLESLIVMNKLVE